MRAILGRLQRKLTIRLLNSRTRRRNINIQMIMTLAQDRMKQITRNRIRRILKHPFDLQNLIRKFIRLRHLTMIRRTTARIRRRPSQGILPIKRPISMLQRKFIRIRLTLLRRLRSHNPNRYLHIQPSPRVVNRHSQPTTIRFNNPMRLIRITLQATRLGHGPKDLRLLNRLLSRNHRNKAVSNR